MHPTSEPARDPVRRIRLLWWNTFLLRPPGILPRRIDVGLDPGVGERADRIGTALHEGGYDVASLTEVFADGDHDRVARRLPGHAPVRGPLRGDRRARLVGSGLATFTAPPIRRVVRHPFGSSGSRLLDSDAQATKGVLLVELGGRAEGVEVAVTHLHAGGWGIVRRSSRASGAVRAAQVRELVDVLGTAHRPGNLLLVGGDFNIDPGAEDPDEPDLVGAMAQLGLVDLWPVHGSGPGWTSPGTRLADLAHPDPTDARFARDDVAHLDRTHELQRIDLLFGPPPHHDGPTLADVVLRRRGFPAQDMATSRLSTLSDHMALHLDARIEA